MKNDYTNQNSELNKRPAYLEDYEIEVNLKRKAFCLVFFINLKKIRNYYIQETIRKFLKLI